MNKFAALMNYIRTNMSDDEIGLAQVLSFIHQENAQGASVNQTRLIRMICFGTGPTVKRKIADLEFRGLICISKSGVDLRSKTITMTKQGERYLMAEERAVMNVIAEMHKQTISIKAVDSKEVVRSLRASGLLQRALNNGPDRD